MKIETALILCAGYGKRVKPLTDITPKPLLKINDLTLLQRCINLIEGLDINHILLNTFYLQDEIKNYIKNNNFKAKISIIEDGDQILDTGGGILNLMNSSSSEDFFIFNPDTLWSKDYLIELEEMESIYFKKKLNNVLMLVDENLSFDEFWGSVGFDKYIKTCLWNLKNNKGAKITKKYNINRDTVSISDNEEVLTIVDESAPDPELDLFLEDSQKFLTEEEMLIVSCILRDPNFIKTSGKVCVQAVANALNKPWHEARKVLDCISQKIQNQL